MTPEEKDKYIAAMDEVVKVLENMCKERNLVALLSIAPNVEKATPTQVYHGDMTEERGILLCTNFVETPHIKFAFARAIISIATGATRTVSETHKQPESTH